MGPLYWNLRSTRRMALASIRSDRRETLDSPKLVFDDVQNLVVVLDCFRMIDDWVVGTTFGECSLRVVFWDVFWMLGESWAVRHGVVFRVTRGGSVFVVVAVAF